MSQDQASPNPENPKQTTDEGLPSTPLSKELLALAKEIEWAGRVLDGYTTNKPTSIGVDKVLVRLPEIAGRLREISTTQQTESPTVPTGENVEPTSGQSPD
jgi:hypothetical protein